MNHSMREDALRHLPGLICHEDEPLFHEAWEAGAFAMVLQLCEAGYFTWSEWTTALAREIKTGADRSEANPGEAYYLRWLAALEGLCAEKALVTRTEAEERKAAWRRAYLETPHGQPVELAIGSGRSRREC